ncbi:hypothetical protein MKW98_030162 [Papaver atlanticum]|uniref:Ubiquitin-like protease family profile domain-containing protein n=1 Tax=Papaver atlanticum TaxID=357466 RepID=A0AAD4XJT8_9MAGN|nr:hypothetical protein MKW98_030162 [Papaver atlanticum]
MLAIIYDDTIKVPTLSAFSRLGNYQVLSLFLTQFEVPSYGYSWRGSKKSQRFNASGEEKDVYPPPEIQGWLRQDYELLQLVVFKRTTWSGALFHYLLSREVAYHADPGEKAEEDGEEKVKETWFRVWSLEIFPGLLQKFGERKDSTGWKPHILTVSCNEVVHHQSIVGTLNMAPAIRESITEHTYDSLEEIMLGEGVDDRVPESNPKDSSKNDAPSGVVFDADRLQEVVNLLACIFQTQREAVDVSKKMTDRVVDLIESQKTMLAKITLLENDVACLKQRNDEEPPFEGDYHDEEISHRSVSRNLNFILDDIDMGGENDKEGTKQMVLMLPPTIQLTFQTAQEEKNRMHREFKVSSNSNDDDDVKIIPKAAKVKRETIPSRFRRPPYTEDGRNQKKPRKKVESKESVIRNNINTQTIDWQNKEDINDLFCFLDQSKIHGELYNDNGMSLVNCGDLSRLLDPSGWLGDEVINKTLYLLRKSKYFTGANYTWTYFETYMLKILENKNDKVMERIRLGISPKHDGAHLLPWDEVSIVYGVLNVEKTHWVALTIQMTERRITIYDSKIPPRNGKSANIYEEIEILHKYLRGVTGSGEWHCIFYKDLPQQTDGSSCGVFAIKFIEHMIRDISFQKIEQSKTPRFRCEIALQLFKKQLIEV